MEQNPSHKRPAPAASRSAKPPAPSTGLASPDPAGLREAARCLTAPGGTHVRAVGGEDAVRRISHEWTSADWWGQFSSRISAYRMKYDVAPGLYALGNPDPSSDIFVSANYKLSFDILRRALGGFHAWILVLDTKGINVWCAAGKGTFGTAELARRIRTTRLAERVSHRRLIVPQLGAPGIKASDVKRATGFSIHFGPIDAKDIISYIEMGYRASPEMRRVPFSFIARLVLTPMEIRQSLKYAAIAALAILVLFGIQPHGIIFRNAWSEGYPYLLFLVLGIFAGTLLTPALLPVIPSRSFAVKGWLAGVAAVAPPVMLTLLGGESFFYRAAALVLFPLISSYLALQFTGASTYTGPSGVRREIKLSLPFYIIGACAALMLLAVYKIKSWGLL